MRGGQGGRASSPQHCTRMSLAQWLRLEAEDTVTLGTWTRPIAMAPHRPLTLA